MTHFSFFYAFKGEVQVNYSIDLDKNILFRRLYIENVNGSLGEQTSYTANFSLGTEPNKEKCDTQRTVLLKVSSTSDVFERRIFDIFKVALFFFSLICTKSENDVLYREKDLFL